MVEAAVEVVVVDAVEAAAVEAVALVVQAAHAVQADRLAVDAVPRPAQGKCFGTVRFRWRYRQQG